MAKLDSYLEENTHTIVVRSFQVKEKNTSKNDEAEENYKNVYQPLDYQIDIQEVDQAEEPEEANPDLKNVLLNSD